MLKTTALNKGKKVLLKLLMTEKLYFLFM